VIVRVLGIQFAATRTIHDDAEHIILAERAHRPRPESIVVVPMRTTSTVPEHSVDSRFASCGKQQWRAIEMTQLNALGSSSMKYLHLASVEEAPAG
jgi:hypothetical protein